MRNWLIGALATPLVLALVPASQAAGTPLQGTVIASESRWAYEHSLIITESLVEAADGSRVTVQQAGGSVDGIGMRRSHGLAILAVGDRVVGSTEPKATKSGHTVHSLVNIQQLRRASPDKDAQTHEFVRTENTSAQQIYWKSGCALLSVHEQGSSQISGDEEFRVIDEVLRSWNDGSDACSEFTLINEGKTSRDVGFDGHNIIRFREDLWCRPATEDNPEECYDQAAAGITTLFFVDDDGSDRNGEILDADVELNGVQFAFAVDGETSGSAQCEADFANTLTHELGHLLGLDHTCWVGGQRLLDNNGNTVPSCTLPTLSEEITEATMYNFQSCGETKKASLEADDIAGMCAIYPIGEHPSTCKPASLSSAGCCSLAVSRNTHSNQGAGILAVFGFFGLLLVLRRRGRN